MRAASPSSAPWLLAAALLLSSFVAYAPALEFHYVQDAYHAVKINPIVERGSLSEIFSSDYWKETISPARTLYRPVTVASFALERRLVGRADPAFSHLIGFLLHAGAAWLLFWLTYGLGAGQRASAIAALLFAAHPLALQAVVNVVARADLLVACFGLSSTLCLMLALPEAPVSVPGGLRRLGAWGAGATLFLALGSKESAVALPAVLGILALWRRDRERRFLDVAVALGPSVIAVLLYLHLRTIAIGEFPGLQRLAAEDNILVGLTGWPRWINTLAFAGRCAWLLAWPARLLPDYSGAVIERETTLLAPFPILGLVLLTGLLALALLPWFRTAVVSPYRRTASFGAWWFLLFYLAIGNILVLNAAGFAERMIYVPAAGVCVIAGAVLAALPARLGSERQRLAWRGVWAFVIVLALAGIVQTRRLSPMWRSNQALFDYTLEHAPRSLRANLARLGELRAAGDVDGALQIDEQILSFAPEYGGAWLDRGILLARRGQFAEAERSLRRSIELRPEVGEAHLNLGLVLARTGNVEEAERALRRALLLDSRLVRAAAQLGHLLFEQRRFDEAVHFYRGCVELGREDLRPRLREAEQRAGGRPGTSAVPR